MKQYTFGDLHACVYIEIEDYTEIEGIKPEYGTPPEYGIPPKNYLVLSKGCQL